MNVDDVIELIRIGPCKYRDQYGVEHDAEAVIEIAYVTVTHVDTYEHYGTKLPMYIGKDQMRIVFKYYSATDYGCSGSWSSKDGDKIVPWYPATYKPYNMPLLIDDSGNYIRFKPS